jgi:hypothetical protein
LTSIDLKGDIGAENAAEHVVCLAGCSGRAAGEQSAQTAQARIAGPEVIQIDLVAIKSNRQPARFGKTKLDLANDGRAGDFSRRIRQFDRPIIEP